MTRIWSAVLVAMALAGCATNEPQATAANAPQATAEEKAAAFAALRGCAVKNVPTIDDGVSDANTIAVALAGICVAEYNAITNVFSRGLGGRAAQMVAVSRQRPQAKAEMLTPIVLEFRSYMRRDPAAR